MDMTEADIAQNKAINDLAGKVDQALATLNKLLPLIDAIESISHLVDRVEHAVQRLEQL